MNVTEGEPSERTMTTGNHTVRDIFCVKCGTVLGWKYVRRRLRLLPFPFHLATKSVDIRCSFNPLCYETALQDYAHEPSQKYKEGKYILERNLLVDVQ